jgi:hypothetical protein
MNEATEIKALLIFIGCTYFLFAAPSLFLILKPPRKVNSLFAYHSENASRNQSNWDYANKVAFRLMFLIANMSLVLALVSVYFLKGKIPTDGLWAICAFWLCFLYMLVLPIVEIKLSKFEEKRNSGQA